MNHHYTAIAKALHWIMAVMVVCLFSVGLYMHDLPFSPEKLKLYSWHKWTGICIFMLALFRLGWRIAHAPPALPQHMKKLEKWAAHSGHFLLYTLLFAIPLSGWLMSSAKGIQTVLFGVVPIPDLIAKNSVLGEQLKQVHWTLNWFLAAIVLGHIAAALKHHFIDHDDVLSRMLPHKKTPEPTRK